MPVPTLITELSTTIASNSPPGSESPSSLDDYQRAHAAFIAQLRDGKAALAGSATQAFAASLLKVGPESTAPWSSAIRAVDIGSMSAIFQLSLGQLGLAKNLYTDNDGATWRYRRVGMAQLLWLGPDGEFGVYTAPSAGGAGTAASLSNRLQIANTGVVTFGANTALHTGNVFHGRVNADGTAARLPAGWASTRLSAGAYQITHPLNTIGYSVGGSASFGIFHADSPYPSTSTFHVRTDNLLDGALDRHFRFILILD